MPVGAAATSTIRSHRVERMLRWAAEEELVPPGVDHGLQAVAGLKKNRTNAHVPGDTKRESKPAPTLGRDGDPQAIRSRSGWGKADVTQV